MKTAAILLIVSAVIFASAFAQQNARQRAGSASPKEYAKQLRAQQALVVTTPGWDSVDGKLLRMERVNGSWQQVGSEIPVVVGKSGLAWDGAGPRPSGTGPVKKEGDGRSPAGVFAITELFGFADSFSDSKLPYQRLTTGIECVDDVKSSQYNKIVDRNQIASPDWNSSEKMSSVDVYQFGAVVGYNAKSKPGAGSCIFLHIWKGAGHGTAGCTAMDEVQLKEVLTWLDASKHPVLVQFPEQVYQQVKNSWQLP